jgi:hypothetical protein
MDLSLQMRILSTRTVPMPRPRPRRIPSLFTYIGIGVAYVGLAVLHSYPLIRHLDSSLPGLGLGDNVTFVWNSWWMREALASPSRQFFNTDAIFAPLGVSLVLHTHTALPAFVGATLLARMSPAEAQNILLIASLALNGLFACALTALVTRSRWPAFAAGALFVVSPAVTTRLMGHYNLVLAWTLVAGCTALAAWWRQPNRLRGLAVGVAFASIVYADYYYAAYFGIFAIAYAISQTVSIRLRFEPVDAARSARILGAAAIAAFLIGVVIVVASPQEFVIGNARVSVRTPTNAFTVGWLFLLLAAVLRARPMMSATRRPDVNLREVARDLAVPAVVAGALLVPLLVASLDVIRMGDYVTASASLKSSARGIDPATLALGPPFSGAVGEQVRSLYQRFGIDAVESSAWLGVIVITVVALGARHLWHSGETRRWIVIGGLFAIWALGPYLFFLGRNTGLLLPQALARFVPILNNARIPGRALVVVDLCVLIAFASLLARFTSPRSRAFATVLTCAAVIERLATPLPMTPLPDVGVYQEIAADSGSDAVLTVPFGIRDGFGERGVFKTDALYGQTIHRHRLVGGFVARLPPRIATWYGEHEPFSSLLTLSERKTVAQWPDCDAISQGLKEASVSWIVLYDADAAGDLSAFVRTRMPLTRVAADNTRTLFRVSACP